jgi:hypothetical protein
VLTGSLAGRFVLAYADGQLVETIHKRAGTHDEIAVYPGNAVLSYYRDGQVLVQENIGFSEESPVVLRGPQDLAPTLQPGQGNTNLWVKGFGKHELVATTTNPTTSVTIGSGPFLSFGPDGILSAPRGLLAWARLDRGSLWVAVGSGYGWGAKGYSSWSYELDAWRGEVRGGVAVNLSPARLSAGVVLAVERLWQSYGDSLERRAWMLQPAGYASLLVPSHQPVGVEVFGAVGPARAPGVGRNAGPIWTLGSSFGLAVMVRL